MKIWWISQTPWQQRETQNGEVPLSRWHPPHAGRQSKNGVWPRRWHLLAATRLRTQRGKRGSKPSWESRSFQSSSSGTWELPACVGSAPPPAVSCSSFCHPLCSTRVGAAVPWATDVPWVGTNQGQTSPGIDMGWPGEGPARALRCQQSFANFTLKQFFFAEMLFFWVASPELLPPHLETTSALSKMPKRTQKENTKEKLCPHYFSFKVKAKKCGRRWESKPKGEKEDSALCAPVF